MLRVALPRKHETRAEVLTAKGLGGGADRPLEHVVGEHDAAWITVDEALRKP